MVKSLYVRKTANPNMGWSDERRAEFSRICKEAHKNGTWYKKKRSEVHNARANGRKEAQKFRNRSEGQRKRHANKGLAEATHRPDVESVKTDKWRTHDLRVILDLIEEHFGVRPKLSEFINNAVTERIAKFKAELCNK